MELVRQKNAATYITFPIVDADGDFVTGATGLDSEIDAWTDGAAPDGFADCTNEATEIGSTGIYYLSLTQTEMNADYIVVQIKTTSSGAKTQMILINTMIGDPLNRATHTSGRELDVSAGGEAGVDWANVGSPTTTLNLSGTTVKTATDVETDTQDIQARLPAALVSGRIDASVGAIAANAITAASMAADASQEIADTVLDRANGIETSFTLRQTLRLVLSSVVAKLSGAATTTVAIRDINDSKDRITATVDADGNRTAVTVDAT